MNRPKVAFYTLGCKLNFAETSTIERLFEEKGFQKVDFSSRADVVVINTCTVTASADKKCRNIINKAVRLSPEACIAVVGCYSQLKAREISKIPGVDLVLGSGEKFRIFDYAGGFRKRNKPAVCVSEIAGEKEFYASYSVAGRTRSFLKIQDGCDYYCSYCVIPVVRGHSRSASIGDILGQVGEISKSGVKEVVLTGVNVGDYGSSGSENLLILLHKLEKNTDIERFRISSIEPDLLSDDIISFVAGNKRFAPHFHIPLQSGCDHVLAKMKRKYDRSLFTDRVAKIREEIPSAGIGADVITGFPGETKQYFEETVDFLEGSDIAFMHVFSYSDRSSAGADRLPGKVSPGEKDRRSRILRRLADEKLKVFQEKFVGQRERVLFEAINKKGRMCGFTGNYLRVEAPVDKRLINRIVDVELTDLGEDGILKGFIRDSEY